jgi:hypothetical protein
MKRNFLLFLFLTASLFYLPTSLQAQIVEQPFDGLNNLEEFRGSPPNEGQVDHINLNLTNAELPLPIFSLGSEGGDKFLLVEKRGRQTRHFSRESDINDAAALKIQFDLTGVSGNNEGKVMAIFIGKNLGESSFTPDKVNRWAQLLIMRNEDNSWFIQNEEEGNIPNASTFAFPANQQETITIFANNSGGEVLYEAPYGGPFYLQNQSVSVWIGDIPIIPSAPAYLGANSDISGVKFLTWNTELSASLRIDNLLLEEPEIDPLPVNLLSFDVKQAKEHIEVAWQTSWEKNNSHFEVQRSADGQAFTAIGEVAGQGTSTQLHNYTFADKEGLEQGAGKLYYRLKQVDFDGAFEYSPVRVLMLPHKAFSIAEVGPNPFDRQLKVQINSQASEHLQIRLLNSQGQTVLEESMFMETGAEEKTIQLNNSGKLEAGLYLMEVRSAKSRELFRLLKQ